MFTARRRQRGTADGRYGKRISWQQTSSSVSVDASPLENVDEATLNILREKYPVHQIPKENAVAVYLLLKDDLSMLANMDN